MFSLGKCDLEKAWHTAESFHCRKVLFWYSTVEGWVFIEGLMKGAVGRCVCRFTEGWKVLWYKTKGWGGPGPYCLCVSANGFPPSVTDYCQAFKTALWVNLKINSLKNVDIYSPSWCSKPMWLLFYETQEDKASYLSGIIHPIIKMSSYTHHHVIKPRRLWNINDYYL